MPAIATASVRYPILPQDQIKALVRRYRRTHDPVAADLLMRSHYRLVAKIARKYRWARQDLSDLIQAGCMGFMCAIEKFDGTRGVALSTYAVHWIRAYITRAALKSLRLVRIGTTQRQRQIFRLAHEEREDLPEKDKALLRHMTVPELSLDEPVSEGEDGVPASRLTLLRAPEESRPDLLVEGREARVRMQAAVSTFAAGLRGRERVLFKARWMQAEQPTLATIGLHLGISRERVRQLERRILDRLELHLRRELGDLRAVAPALAVAA